MKFTEIVLSQADIDILNKYKSFGTKWLEEYTLQTQARAYVKQFMDKYWSEYKTPYNCFHTGKERYKRKDGQSFTQDDIDALKTLSDGQMNKVNCTVGDMEAYREWECDSGD